MRWPGTNARGALLGTAALGAALILAVSSRAHRSAAARAASFASSAPEGAYERGQALRFLPVRCPSYRIYVDSSAVVATLRLADVLTPERVPGPWKTVFETFERAHLRLGGEIQDIAVCADRSPADDDAPPRVHVVLGGEFGGREALHKYRGIVQALTHAKDTEVLEREANGVPYLVSSYSPTRKWIAMPASDVLVFYTDSVAEVGVLAKPHGLDPRGWGLTDETLVRFDLSGDDAAEQAPGESAPSSSGELSVSLEAGEPVLRFDARIAPSGDVTPALLSSFASRLAQALEESGFTGLADPVRRMTLEAPGQLVLVRLVVPVAKVIEAGEAASAHPDALPDLMSRLRRLLGRRP